MRSFDAAATADAIERVQLRDGSIPWHRDGHLDPWNMVEAAMGLDAAGRRDAARAAYRWLIARQRSDGAWAAAFRGGLVEDDTLDANFCSYLAAGTWHHYLATGDLDFLAACWPAVDRAMGFVLRLQMASGAIAWARDRDYRPWPGALLTGSACIHLSLGCALEAAAVLGYERLEWELARSALGAAVAGDPAAFLEKDRFSMDWYYPVLGGVVTGAAARSSLLERWDEFVIEGRGCRCVSDRPWVTTGETCELVLALDAAGMRDEARAVFAWVQHLRRDDGDYWTGATWPEDVVWPRETTTWGAGSVLLAADALEGS
ncbi:MAG TPA: prenyltransferase, partial [Actinomycetota bacterium]|nr:prenyltransferase [Actinomycetota bacterium]